MRDYKFRGWSTDFNKWVYGYACFSPNKERAVIIHKQGGNDMQHTDVVPESVGEWTGLKDNVLTEIYEGDIVSNGYESNQIIFIAPSLGTKTSEGFITYSTAWEIIGNVYQNTELLNQ